MILAADRLAVRLAPLDPLLHAGRVPAEAAALAVSVPAAHFQLAVEARHRLVRVLGVRSPVT